MVSIPISTSSTISLTRYLLRITNLVANISESEVHQHFKRFGQIIRIFLSREKGFAFVELESENEEVKYVDTYTYEGRSMSVDLV